MRGNPVWRKHDYKNYVQSVNKNAPKAENLILNWSFRTELEAKSQICDECPC